MDPSTFEVIVIDNNSHDGSADTVAEYFPQATLIRSSENLGFASGNNLAATYAKGDYLLLLNPDTVVLSNAIENLLLFAQKHGGHGIYGGRTLFADHTLNPSSCWKSPSLWSLFCVASGISKLCPGSNIFTPDSMPQWQRDSHRQVDIVSGCFLMLARSTWEELDGFDPNFHMYAEEFDLCMRAKQLDITCHITPDAQIIHYGGASEPARADKMCRLFQTKILLFKKHWHPLKAWLATQLIKLWVLSRLVGTALLDKIRKRKARQDTWVSIWKRRDSWLAAKIH